MFIEANALSERRMPIFTTSDKGIGVHKPTQLREDHILIIHGGADISPSLYGSKLSQHGCGMETPSVRDQQEWEMITQAVKMGIPIVGICRGAQMLCAFEGGKLVQHIVDHTGRDHKITDKESGEKVISNSCHHQMMVPSKHAKIIASCTQETLGYDDDDKAIFINEVPEIVYFPSIKAIGIQGHPEWAGRSSPFVEYCSRLINNLLLKG